MHIVRVLATNLTLAALVIAAAALALAADRFWPFALPAQLALLGWPLLLLGALPLLAAEYCLLAFGHATGAPADAPRRLVTQGIYAWVRNPIYLGAAMLLFGVAFLNSSPTLLLIAVAFLALIDTYVVRVEEPRLERRFGAGYLRYKQDAPRWLPRRPQRSRP